MGGGAGRGHTSLNAFPQNLSEDIKTRITLLSLKSKLMRKTFYANRFAERTPTCLKGLEILKKFVFGNLLEIRLISRFMEMQHKNSAKNDLTVMKSICISFHVCGGGGGGWVWGVTS